MQERKLNHLDYAEEAESAQRASAWPQAAALWRRAAEVCDQDGNRDQYLRHAIACDHQAAVEVRFEEIARHVLGIPTLKTRHSDRADFHELPVARIKLALRAAYEAGRASRE